MASVSLSASEMERIARSGVDLLSHLRSLAGIGSGEVRIYVDGLLADRLPPADRIQSASINTDPFSAAFADGGATRVDIITKEAERRLGLRNVSLSRGTPARDGLDSHLTSVSRTGGAGLIGPVPYTPFAFTSDVSVDNQRRGVPIEAVVPQGGEHPLTPLTNAVASNRNTMTGLGLGYAGDTTLRVDASFYALASQSTNDGLTAVDLPTAGSSQRRTAREFRVTVSAHHAAYTYHGGLSIDGSNDQLDANDRGASVTVPGAFAAGGAPNSQVIQHRTRWALSHALAFDVASHPWSVGTTVTQTADRGVLAPNAFGSITFATPNDYVLGAGAGAHTGTAMVTRGSGDAGYTSTMVALFVDGELLAASTLSVRGGLRADYQTEAGGVFFSPRLSAVTNWRGFIVTAGTGAFVDEWSNATFLKTVQYDENHLQRFLVHDASFSDIATGAPAPPTRVASTVADNLRPARNWISELSVERAFGNSTLGGEWSSTIGTHHLGSRRLAAPGGWADVLESNRSVRQQRLRAQLLYKAGALDLAAHYELVNARDNTDGPFSFPARQLDVRAEWGPSVSTPRQSVSLTAAVQLGAAMAITLMHTWHGPTPVNLTTGEDAEGNGLFTDRGGLARNRGMLPAFRSIDVYANRIINVRSPFGREGTVAHLNLALQLLNLTGDRSVRGIGTVIGSPLYGQPTAAVAGRAVRFTVGL
jgi:hypothetical protein